jgi:glycosyltransferase involved in cell wall biosynthesis
MAPTAVQVIPGIRRYAFGRMRIPIATWYAHSAAPIIARQAADADVIHVWGDGFLAIAGVAAARRVGAPVLITPFIHKGQWGDDPASALAYRRADRVIGLLDYDCQVIRGLGPADARVVECPVCSPGVARGGGRAWRQRHGVYGPLIVFLGVRRAYKGFDLLLSALPELGRRVPRATVVFAGPGESIGGDHPVRVIDRGRVSDEERAALLDAGDALCLPSAGEIFPVTILEAWSAETAVLTSDIPPLRELMRRSGGGIAVPRDSAAIADGLAAILNDGERRYATAGHRYWRTNATVEAVVNRHVDLYRSTISAAGALGSAG